MVFCSIADSCWVSYLTSVSWSILEPWLACYLIFVKILICPFGLDWHKGRNRDLQGLAVAMAKLWERSAIAKIAIKRGVHNTCNERMAEELKVRYSNYFFLCDFRLKLLKYPFARLTQRLTGGTLVSRNKDYIVFYRGNDFLPPNVTRTLNEAQDLSINRQEDEDRAREKASTFIDMTTKNAAKVPLVAGTLAETLAATSRWGTEPSNEEIEKMRRDSAVARHTSLVRLLQKKLSLVSYLFDHCHCILGYFSHCTPLPQNDLFVNCHFCKVWLYCFGS